eukprot:2105447-Prymnesium_polylepis.1
MAPAECTRIAERRPARDALGFRSRTCPRRSADTRRRRELRRGPVSVSDGRAWARPAQRPTTEVVVNHVIVGHD